MTATMSAVPDSGYLDPLSCVQQAHHDSGHGATSVASPWFRADGGVTPLANNHLFRSVSASTSHATESALDLPDSLSTLVRVSLEPELVAMRPAIRRMKKVARHIDSHVKFSDPRVQRIGDDDGDELTLVIVDVLIPRAWDGMAFRDRFFPQLTKKLSRLAGRERLAVGVAYQNPDASR